MTKRLKFEYVRSTKRHDSIIKEFDLRTENSSTYTAIQWLGGGAYGDVRLFSNGEHQLAVKSPAPAVCLNAEEVEKDAIAIKKEYDLTKIAYPDDHYSLSVYVDQTPHNETMVDYRFIMPFVEGKTLTNTLNNSIEFDELPKMFLRIAQELSRIHRLGILHGDPNPENIFIIKKHNDYQIRLIDFGISYRMTDSANNLFDLPQGPISAPERHQAEPIPANRRQDSYSLAKLFNWVISTYFPDNHHEKYPSLDRFIFKGTRIKQSERQRLTAFITSISVEILSYDIPESLKTVCAALFNDRETLLKKRLATLPKESNKDIITLLHQLIKHHCYREVKMLLAAKEKLLHLSSDRLTKLLAQIVKSSDFPISLLREILAVYIPKRKLSDILVNPVGDHKSTLHLAIKYKRVDMLIDFIKHLSKTARADIWDDGWELEDINKMRQDDQKVMIDLALYIHRLYEEYIDQPEKKINRLFTAQNSMSQACLARHIKVAGYLMLFITPSADPFDKILFMDDFAEVARNCKFTGKEYFDRSLIEIFQRMKDSATYLEKSRIARVKMK